MRVPLPANSNMTTATQAAMRDAWITARRPRLVADVDWSRPEAAVPAFLVIAGVPLTFSIAAGIGLGVLGYVATMTATGRASKVHPLMWALVPMFLAFFASDWLSANVF